MGSLTSPKVVVIDFTKDECMKQGSNSWSSTCKEVVQALEEFGYFVALYDKISPQLQESIFQAAVELFDLPNETKAQNTYEKPYHGYLGQVPIVPLHEGLGIDCATTLQGAQSFTNLMWPKGNDSFCETSLAFAKTVEVLEKTVVKMLFESYGVEKYLDSHIESKYYLQRYLKYRTPKTGETNVGFPSHSDKSFISILYQNHVSGLEVMTRDGQWVLVEFPPSSFVVMAGDACKAWSNGKIASPNHKVIMKENGTKERYAMGLFSFLNNVVQVPKELVDEEHPLKYKPFLHLDLLRFYNTERGMVSQNLLEDFCAL